MTAISRAVTIAMLTAILVGAYVLIAANAASTQGPTATAAVHIAPPKPKGVTGEIQEGTGI